ncbi:MAG: LytTR family transcriptional regulator DNA-binding domain-containing protein, partial [Saprospiraceae bacterium]
KCQLTKRLHIKINPKQLLHEKKKKNTITIYVSEKVYEVKTSLRKLLKILPGNKFIKIHKQYIIQVNAIEFINYKKNKLVIQSHEIPIGRKFKSDLMDRINIIN